ncbi:hypothetical protein DL98DRAFT_540759 [Cadophora sp. DSE1049]|nr:hypothetical protein DL98DRAFT_540759 [Cadophora sp. DSE1049]
MYLIHGLVRRYSDAGTDDVACFNGVLWRGGGDGSCAVGGIGGFEESEGGFAHIESAWVCDFFVGGAGRAILWHNNRIALFLAVGEDQALRVSLFRPAAEAGTEFATQGAGEMEEKTLFVDDMPTAADGSGRRRAGEDELDDRAS